MFIEYKAIVVVFRRHTLLRVLAEMYMQFGGFHLYYPSGRHMPAATRALVGSMKAVAALWVALDGGRGGRLVGNQYAAVFAIREPDGAA